MKKLRLCYFGDANSIHTKRWLGYFYRNGHDVLLVNTGVPISDSLDFKVVDFPKDTFPLPILKSLFFIPKLKKIIDAYNPDFVHIHFLNRRAIWSVLASSYPVIITVWGSDVFLTLYSKEIQYNNILIKILKKIAFKKALFITADSRNLLEGAFKLGAKKSAGEVIQFGTDPEVFKPGLNVNSLKKEFSIINERIVFCPRGIKWIYNTDIVIKAFKKVLEKLPNTILVLPKYNAYSNNYNRKIEKLIKNLGLEEKLIIPNRISYEDMPLYYNLADVVVSIPSSDGTPVSLLEAMASGTGLVFSDLPSIREWINDGDNGLLVPVGSVEETAKGLIKYLKMPSTTKAKWALKNISISKERADHSKNMERMEQIYYQLRSK